MAYQFSPSSLWLLQDCPRCFWLRFRKGVKRPRGIFPSLPSGMDKILKEYYGGFIDKGGLPPELEEGGMLPETVRMFSDKAKLRVWQHNFRGIRWKDKDGNRFMGAVDSLLRDRENGKLIVLDFKTRGYPLKEDSHEYYRNQMDIYNLLLRKNGYETEDFSLLAFYHPIRAGEGCEIKFQADIVRLKVDTENARGIFRKALEVVEGGKPEASETCEYCNWERVKKGQTSLTS